MLERLERRGAQRCAARAAARRAAMAARLRGDGLAAVVEGESVVVSGLGLRRLTAEPELRWRILEARDE